MSESSGLKFLIPPATPPGDYTIEVVGRGLDGRSISTALLVTVDAVTISPAAAAARPPVILLNGFQLVCLGNTDSTLAASVSTFGQLYSLLNADGVGVAYFNNCTYGDISIEQLAGQLNNYIAGLHYTDGTPINQVDLVVHSMGGLIARAYLAGKGQSSGVFSPPANSKIRKLVAIATPHFGSFQAAYIGNQESEMALGNQFLWDLATWNQGQDDLRGVDALAIIGNAGTYGSTSNASDGVVSLTSGSFGFAQPDQRTRIVPYCHITPGLLTGLGMSCANHQGIADINDPSHLSWQILRSFLADTTAWQSVGNPPSTDPFLSRYGGMLLALKGTNDVYFTDLTAVSFDNATGSLVAGPSSAIASLYYSEFIAGGQHSFSMTHSNLQVTTGTGTPVAGLQRALLFKFGPVITGVRSAAGGLPGLTVAAGSNITVNGGGFVGPGTQLSANGASLTISGVSDQQITAFLPGGYNGLVQLKVTNGNGHHTVNIMAAPAPPPISVLSLDRSQLNFDVTTNGSAFTSSQVVHLTTAAGVTWNVGSNQSFVTVSPTSGIGPASFTVSVQSAGLTTPGNLQANVSVTSNGISNSPQNVIVNVSVLNPSSVNAPFGSFDTPVNNTNGIAGAVPITGWALDQIEVTHVDILREPVIGEPAGSLIFVGTAVFVADARPDVQSMFSTYPFQYRAGWGYQMLTNFLPNASGSGAPGNGTYKIHAIAHDRSGLTTDLGTKTIGVDNAHAAKPFGTIDTPTQGGTISGSDVVNFAWALTQQPFMIPADGSTIAVVIDGAVVGHPTYNNYRSDIATLFPGYANSGGAVGFFHLNTTTLANGVHTISWNVFDSGARGDGIGSRYFNVFNAGGPVAAPEEPAIATPETVTIPRGIHPDRETQPLLPDHSGRYIISMEELGRIELQLGATRGYLMVNGERHALPLGSTLKNGVFNWQAGVGYLGRYELSFEQARGGTVGVWVTITPKTF